MELDTPDDKGVSKRKRLMKVYEQSGVKPPELEADVEPELEDIPIFNMFFEIFQREQNFYQTIYYYQQVMGFEFDGEDLSLLQVLWNNASRYLYDKDKKKRDKDSLKAKKPSGRNPSPRRR